MSEVTIVMSGHGRGEVFIDGEKVPHVREVTFNSKVNSLNEVQLSMVPDKVTVDGVALVDVTSIDNPFGTKEWRLSYD